MNYSVFYLRLETDLGNSRVLCSGIGVSHCFLISEILIPTDITEINQSAISISMLRVFPNEYLILQLSCLIPELGNFLFVCF